MMNTKLNMNELIKIAGGTGPLSEEGRPVGWPNGWDVSDKESLQSCDPACIECVGPVEFPPQQVVGIPRGGKIRVRV